MSNPVIRKLSQLPGLSAEEHIAIEPVTEKFAFRVSPYYSDLIDWSNPDDPLRKIVLPDPKELESEGDFDPSEEAMNTMVPGLQHKYRQTALLLVNDFCAAYCRFCFRKRFTLGTDKTNQIKVGEAEKETTFNVQDGIEYIAAHREINNVLLTGGDPLMLALPKLAHVMERLRQIPHVRIIRIGTKVPPFDPERITSAMLDILAAPGPQVYLMVQYNHPRELTERSLKSMADARARGLTVYNQTPLLRGVNDDPDLLAELLGGLAENGITPYYVFHCRPTIGNDAFMLSVQEGLEIITETRKKLSGLARCFRYSGSHSTGKIEIVGSDGQNLIFRYHQAKDPMNEGRILTWPMSEPIMWFDSVVAACCVTA